MTRLSFVVKVTTLLALTCLMATLAFAGKGQGKHSGKGDLQQWWQSLNACPDLYLQRRELP